MLNRQHNWEDNPIWFINVTTKVEMNDLGELHYSLGVEFERNKESNTIIMNQRSYIEKVLKHFNMEKMQTGHNFIQWEF